jgi:hypothetical protein
LGLKQSCHQWIIALPLFLFLLIAPFPGHTASDVISIGNFSTMREGTPLPAGWKPLTFPKIPRQTQYTLVKERETIAIRAESQNAASGLTYPVQVNLTEYPIIEWRWKVQNLIQKGDVHRKEGDDYPARIYITFAYDPDRVGFLKKATYRAARLLFGEIPIAAINYIWDGKAATGTIVPNAYTDFVRMIVVESGPQKVGQWVSESRNLYHDYKTAFGEDPPFVNGVAVMTDTDNTGEEAIAYYGEIVFKRGP